MNNKSNFRRGSVELLILHLLSQQDYYGYEISTLIREQTDGYLNIPVGSLYPALYKLIDAGYISDYKKQVGRRQVNVYYHLEDSGRTHLQQLLEDYYATANGTDNISRISVSATLYEKGFLGTYHQVSSCSNTSNSTLCTASSSYSLKSGKTYRLDYSATFYYSDGTNETISNSQYKNT